MMHSKPRFLVAFMAVCACLIGSISVMQPSVAQAAGPLAIIPTSSRGPLATVPISASAPAPKPTVGPLAIVPIVSSQPQLKNVVSTRTGSIAALLNQAASSLSKVVSPPQIVVPSLNLPTISSLEKPLNWLYDQGMKILYPSSPSVSTPDRPGSSSITVPTPVIVGTAALDQQLTVSTGDVLPTSATLSYQWYRGQWAISGASQSTYTVTVADVGQPLTVRVTASSPGLTSVSKASVAVTTPVISLSGDLSADSTWSSTSGIYLIDCVTVPRGITLTIEAGAIIKSKGCEIRVDGTLNVAGTASSPVVLTSWRDDSVGGDTDGNGLYPAAICDWTGISVTAGATIQAVSADIRYTCTGVNAHASEDSLATIKLDSTTIQHANTCLNAANPTYGSYFHGVARDCAIGVTVTGDYTLDATGIDWGDATGPAPFGLGPSIDGNVRIFAESKPDYQAIRDAITTPRASCSDSVQIIGARASGISLVNNTYDVSANYSPGVPFSGWDSKVQAVVDRNSTSLEAEALYQNLLAGRTLDGSLVEPYGDDAIEARPVHYPAASTTVIWSQGLSLAGWEEYYTSMLKGKDAVVGELLASCQGEKNVLIGWSQGAWAIHAALAELDWLKREAQSPSPIAQWHLASEGIGVSELSTLANRIVDIENSITAVVLIADPGRSGADALNGAQLVGSAQASGRGLTQHLGGMGTAVAPIPTSIAGRVVSICSADDFVCDPNWLALKGSFGPLGVGYFLGTFGAEFDRQAGIHASYSPDQLGPWGAYAAELTLEGRPPVNEQA